MAPPIVLPSDGVYGCRVASVSDHPEVGGNGLSRPGWEFRVLGFRVYTSSLGFEGKKRFLNKFIFLKKCFLLKLLGS